MRELRKLTGKETVQVARGFHVDDLSDRGCRVVLLRLARDPLEATGEFSDPLQFLILLQKLRCLDLLLILEVRVLACTLTARECIHRVFEFFGFVRALTHRFAHIGFDVFTILIERSVHFLRGLFHRLL